MVCVLALLPIYCVAFAQEPQQSQQPQVVDGMAAIVNGDVITYSQVRQLSAPREKLLRSQFTGQDLENKLQEVRKLALKDLISTGGSIIQAFKKENFEIPGSHCGPARARYRQGELWRRPQYVCQDA